MTRHTAGGGGFLNEPAAVVVAIVGDVEPALGRASAAAALRQAAPSRAQQRRLAYALTADPDLLTSGRPEGPPQVERLIRALLELGAHRIALPRCGHCGQAKRLPQCDGGLRICSDCDRRRRGAAEPCGVCGNTRQIAYRDQHGRPRCTRCRPYDGPDPTVQIAVHVSDLDPGLDHVRLLEVIQQAIPRSFQRHQVAWELDERPTLLTGEGAYGSPRVNTLIQALLAAGAANIVAPVCPSCSRTVRLSHQRGGLRCCRRCYDQHSLRVCSRCQRRTPVASRTAAGEPVCGVCFRADSANHQQCTECGRIRLIVHRDQDALCHRCWRAPIATCSLCGREKPCYFASTDKPRCENCSRRNLPCFRCSKNRAVWTRTADGQPLCGSCSRRREVCTACGSTRTVAARLAIGPLCSTCYRRHPASFRPCMDCGTTEHLYHHGLCTRCACRQQLLNLCSHAEGGLHPHAEAIYQVLAASDPATVLQWLTRSAARKILAEICQTNLPPSHATLDRHPPSRAIHHLRKILVAGDILPRRDERLAQLEGWVTEATAQIADPTERRVVRSFATWHHLRRLRRDSQGRDITAEQAEYVRNDVRAALKLITWLQDRGRSLAASTQRNIDRWLAEAPGTHHKARTFLLWATRRGHAHGVEIPVPARAETVSHIEDDQRWNLVRHLLHDDDLALEDRVAGLLVLLYGQPLARIARLTREQVTQHSTCIQLLLGVNPLQMLPPLDALVRQLVSKRHGRAVVGRTDDHPWLFPGGAPGHPISSSRLKARLGSLGIHGRAGRNTALMDLAAQIPPVVLARLLGIHINTAASWAERTAGSRAAYAAEVFRRR